MGWKHGLAATVTVFALATCDGAVAPDRSPSDGMGADRIVYSRRTGIENQKFLGLFSVGLDGTGEESYLKGVAGPGAHFESVGSSPDGTKIAAVIVVGDRTGTMVMDADGGSPRTFGLGAPDSFALVCDRWSPDGRRLACAGIFDPRRTGVYTVRPDGTDLVRITNVPDGEQPAHIDLPCGFSPDGRRIAFHRIDVERLAGDGELLVVDVDGSGERLVSDVGVDFGCAWSPNGDRLLASGGAGELYLIDLEGTVTTIPRPVEIVNTYAPSFSPDGSAIVFTGWRGDEEHPDVYAMNLDGSGLVQLTDTPGAKEEMAVWVPMPVG